MGKTHTHTRTREHTNTHARKRDCVRKQTEAKINK